MPPTPSPDADILTQLQTLYTQLLTQFFSTTSYLSQRHPLLPPAPNLSDPYTNAPLLPPEPGPEDTTDSSHPLHPVAEETFAQAQVQLAEDLVRKGRQIEELIERLPGGEKTVGAQEEEVRQLVVELRQVEQERQRKRREVRRLVKRLDRVVSGMGVDVEGRMEEERRGINGNWHG